MSYVDSHPRQGAFLGHLLQRLVDLINTQGDELLAAAGLSLPSRAVSSLLLLGDQGQISAADMAQQLNQPHQLVTQRVDKLMALGLVARFDDPSDGRRKILGLTRKGKKELRMLEGCLHDAERRFQRLYEQIECDLSAITIRAMKALSLNPVADRTATSK
ncbi:MAG: MarR family transcriptional regulator [Pseudomonadota bacterium]